MFIEHLLCDPYRGEGMERSQKVLEDHLPRTVSLLWSLIRDAGGLCAQPGDVAEHSLSLVCPWFSTQYIPPARV